MLSASRSSVREAGFETPKTEMREKVAASDIRQWERSRQRSPKLERRRLASSAASRSCTRFCVSVSTSVSISTV